MEKMVYCEQRGDLEAVSRRCKQLKLRTVVRKGNSQMWNSKLDIRWGQK